MQLSDYLGASGGPGGGFATPGAGGGPGMAMGRDPTLAALGGQGTGAQGADPWQWLMQLFQQYGIRPPTSGGMPVGSPTDASSLFHATLGTGPASFDSRFGAPWGPAGQSGQTGGFGNALTGSAVVPPTGGAPAPGAFAAPNALTSLLSGIR